MLEEEGDASIASQAGPGNLECTTAFKRFAGSFATGIGLVTARRGNTDVGCIVTSLASLSVDPPKILICLTRDSATLDGMLASGTFCLSFLGEGSSGQVAASVFSRPGPKTTSLLDCGRSPSGFLTVADSVATGEFIFLEEHVIGDRSIVICEPCWLDVAEEGVPLAHWRGEHRSLGVHSASPLFDVDSTVHGG